MLTCASCSTDQLCIRIYLLVLTAEAWFWFPSQCAAHSHSHETLSLSSDCWRHPALCSRNTAFAPRSLPLAKGIPAQASPLVPILCMCFTWQAGGPSCSDGQALLDGSHFSRFLSEGLSLSGPFLWVAMGRGGSSSVGPLSEMSRLCDVAAHVNLSHVEAAILVPRRRWEC